MCIDRAFSLYCGFSEDAEYTQMYLNIRLALAAEGLTGWKTRIRDHDKSGLSH